MSTTTDKKVFDNILEAIGHTPMVRINRITKGIPATVLAKIETFNPGNSIKDRMAVRMIEDAERKGLLRPGGTIIEGTSGNTGMGLAIAAVIKGYRCVFTTTDKQSKEKIDALKAFGAEVIVCPTDVDPEDPRSYYSVSSRLEKEIPNSWKANQYDNLSNSAAHYEQTGPEIWDQTDGRITHLVCGVGTGGTISGAGGYLKERNPALKVIGVEPASSPVISGGAPGPHKIQGIGAGFVPAVLDRDVLDEMIPVDDEDAIETARLVARREGVLAGISCGAALWAALQVAARDEARGARIVVVMPDSGERYVSTPFFAPDAAISAS
jgi:cystathionine beta-synthase